MVLYILFVRIIMSLIQIIHASVLPWPCYRMVIMLALITIALCRILAYYPHYEPLWVINYYLHVYCRPLGDTNNNIDLALSIVYAQTQTFDLHSFITKEMLYIMCHVHIIYFCTIKPKPTSPIDCNKIMPLILFC